MSQNKMSEQNQKISTGLAKKSANDQGRQPAHIQEAERIQQELIRKMSPARRLEIAREMYETAWKIKEGGLRAQHPDWSESEIAAKLRRIFITGYAGA